MTNTVVEFIQMDDIVQNGWRIVELDEFTHYNLEPTVLEYLV
jgi:hypothetical protein